MRTIRKILIKGAMVAKKHSRHVLNSIVVAALLTTAGAATAAPLSTIPVEMFAQAEWIVKIVIIGLIIASLVSWTIFLAKLSELRKAMAGERIVYYAIASLRSLDEADSDPALGKTVLVKEAAAELALSTDALHDREGIKERIVSRFERYEVALSRNMTRGVTILATIGATAPFVGLFGTVWGIMNSFIGIAEKQTTNLAVVAPGIAEALLATALGLVAAIPAVVMYNHFSRQISAYRALVSDTAAAILRLVSRDLSRGTVTIEKG